MATLRFLLKRFAAQRLLGLAVIVTLAFSVGVLVAGPIYADAAREAIFSSTLSDAGVTVANARYQVFGDEDFDWANADAAVEGALTGVPTDTIVSQGLSTVRFGDTEGPSLPVFFREGAADHLQIRGEAPAAGEIALPSSTAQTAGLQLGDPVTIVGPNDETVTLTLSGTYGSPDREDPFWFGSRNPFPGPDATDPPPLLMDREAYLEAATTLGLTSEFAWDAYLAVGDLTYDEARSVPGQLLHAEDVMSEQPGMTTVRLTTGLDTLFGIVDQRVQNLRIPILLVVIQIGAVTLAVLAGVGALALTRQSFELAVLHSRGFTKRTLLTAQGLQALTYAVVAYPLGLLLGLVLAKLAGRSNGKQLPGVVFPVHLNAGAELLGLLAAAAGAAILFGLSYPLVKRTVLEERRAVSREDRPLLARVPVELFVLPLGIFAYLQLRGGTEVTPGGGTIDPLVLAAPTLLLFGISFLALRLLLFVLRRLDGRIGRTRRVSTYLAGRRVGRSPGTGFAAALLLLLAMGLLVVSTSYRAIVLRNHADAAHTQVGADWNVQVSPPEQVLAAIGDLPEEATAVVRTEPTFSDGSFSLPPTVLGIDPATYEEGGWWRSDFSASSLEDIVEGLATDQLGLPIDAGTLTLALDVPVLPQGMLVQATEFDDAGQVHTVETQLEEGSGSYDLDLDAGRLASITFHVDTGTDLPPELKIGFRSVELAGQPLSIEAWEPITWRSSQGTLEPDGDGGPTIYTMSPGAGNVIGGIWPAPPDLPAVISENWGSAVNAPFDVGVAGQSTTVHPFATANQFPSLVPNAPFVVVSAPAILERQFAIPEAGLTLDEVWANTPDDPSPVLENAGFIPGLVQATAPIEGLLAQLPQSLAVGMNFTAALAGVGLVVIGVAAGLYFTMRRRDYEFAALRAMGTRAGQIRRALILEQVGLLGFALVAGIAIGYFLLRLMMPYVGTSLGVPYPVPVLVIDWAALGVAVVAIVVAAAISLAAAMRFLMRSSVTGVLRGEAE
ncbi:MAG: ABC transporter permease [Actinomycetota bacterium]